MRKERCQVFIFPRNLKIHVGSRRTKPMTYRDKGKVSAASNHATLEATGIFIFAQASLLISYYRFDCDFTLILEKSDGE